MRPGRVSLPTDGRRAGGDRAVPWTRSKEALAQHVSCKIDPVRLIGQEEHLKRYVVEYHCADQPAGGDRFHSVAREIRIPTNPWTAPRRRCRRFPHPHVNAMIRAEPGREPWPTSRASRGNRVGSTRLQHLARPRCGVVTCHGCHSELQPFDVLRVNMIAGDGHDPPGSRANSSTVPGRGLGCGCCETGASLAVEPSRSTSRYWRQPARSRPHHPARSR